MFGISFLWTFVGSPMYSAAGYVAGRAFGAGVSYLWKKTAGTAINNVTSGATAYMLGAAGTMLCGGRLGMKYLNRAKKPMLMSSNDSVLLASDSLTKDSSVNPLVYFIRSGQSSEYKIGRTQGCVEKRLMQLQTGSVEKLSVEFIIYTTDANSLEKCFHKKLTTRRIRPNGEWFFLQRSELNVIEHLVKRWSTYSGETQSIDYPVYKIVDTNNFIIKVTDL